MSIAQAQRGSTATSPRGKTPPCAIHPPKDFPAYLADTLGRAAIMRVFITLDEYWEISDGSYYEDYEIGRARVPVEARHYPYD